MARKTIAVLQGGYTDEAPISFGSATFVMQHLDRELFDPILYTILREKWVAHVDGKEYPIDKGDFSVLVNGEKIRPELVFIAIHGTPGEDGKLQAYFDLQGIPYNTGNVLNTALTFNKAATTAALRGTGYKVADCIRLMKAAPIDEERILKHIGLPCFVKPSNGGSSLGISKVKQASELAAAIELAFAEYDEVMIESYLEGTEVSCGVVKMNGKVQALPLTEIISKNEFFDYEAKYTEGFNEEITPARVTASEYEDCQRTSERIYKELDCRGIVRIDYMINNGECAVIEVNTVPGMSAASILPKQVAVAGISPTALFSATLKEILIGQ